MYYVYAIKSLSRNYIYVGLTNNLERRLNQHQKGQNKTTRPFRPFSILLTESYSSRQDARNREIYLKSGTGKEFLKSLPWPSTMTQQTQNLPAGRQVCRLHGCIGSIPIPGTENRSHCGFLFVNPLLIHSGVIIHKRKQPVETGRILSISKNLN